MKRSRFLFSTLTVILAFAFALTGTVRAAEGGPVAEEYWGPEGAEFAPIIPYGEIVLTISFPNGQVASKTFHESPRFNIHESWGPKYTDGPYTYELRALLKVDPKEEWRMKEFEGIYTPEPVIQAGFFYIDRGTIVPREEEEGQEKRSAPSAETPGKTTVPSITGTTSNQDLSTTKDQCIYDDVIIDGSLCVGFDCTCNYAFGFDTIVLKENNLRIFFDDTSVAASYPRNDWRIIINDSANGGASYFGVEDATASRRVFTLEAGAPSHSLYVDDGGRVGFGTSTPSLELHVKDGDTPSLRLEQDGSSGFAPQTWDVAGNESNFFVRDVTGGSTLPFRIKPGAPSSSLTIVDSGYVGIGTWSPGWPLEIETSGEDAAVVVERTDGTLHRGYFAAGSGYFFAGSISDHPLRFVTGGSYKMQVETDGGLTMRIGGGYYDESNGDWVDGSSREYKENIKALDAKVAMTAFKNLNPVTFRFKIAPEGDQQVGFIAEDVPELVAKRDRKGLAPMDIVAVLTKVMQEQQKVVQKQQEIISQLKERIEKIEKAQQKD